MGVNDNEKILFLNRSNAYYNYFYFNYIELQDTFLNLHAVAALYVDIKVMQDIPWLSFWTNIQTGDNILKMIHSRFLRSKRANAKPTIKDSPLSGPVLNGNEDPYLKI